MNIIKWAVIYAAGMTILSFLGIGPIAAIVIISIINLFTMKTGED